MDYKEFGRPLRRVLKQMGSGSLTAGEAWSWQGVRRAAAWRPLGCASLGREFVGTTTAQCMPHASHWGAVCPSALTGWLPFGGLCAVAGVQSLRGNNKYRIEVARLLGVHPGAVREELANVSATAGVGAGWVLCTLLPGADIASNPFLRTKQLAQALGAPSGHPRSSRPQPTSQRLLLLSPCNKHQMFYQ